jgi:hypothetical protein
MGRTLEERIAKQLNKLDDPALTEEERRAAKDNVKFLEERLAKRAPGRHEKV